MNSGLRGAHDMSTIKQAGMKAMPYGSVTILIGTMTAIFYSIGLSLDLVNIALLFLVPVLLSSVLWNMGSAVYAAALGSLCFDFFFVSPVLSFAVEDLRYLISFGVYLAVAILTASLSARLKRQLQYSKQKEAHTAALYELSRQISDMTDVPTLLKNILSHVSRVSGTDIAIYLPDHKNHLVLFQDSDSQEKWGHGEAEKAMAKLAFDYGEAVGYGSRTLREAPGYYLPLRTESRVLGVLGVHLEKLKRGLNDGTAEYAGSDLRSCSQCH